MAIDLGTSYGTFRIGGVDFPLQATQSGQTPLQQADPTLYFALDFLAQMIRTHVGVPMLVEAAAQGFNWLNSSGQPDVVRNQYPYDVGPDLVEMQASFPALAIWRTKTKYCWEEIGYFSDECDFTLAYVLPPMHPSQKERLLPFMRAIEMVIRQRTVQGSDPTYAPPGGSLGQQWGVASLANYEEFGFDNGLHGSMSGAGKLWFPTLVMKGQVIERDNPVPVSAGGFPPFAGGDLQVDGVAADGTTVPDLVSGSTQQAPTIVGLDVQAGPIAGGTAVTITGSLFLPGPPAVLFGNVPATNVVWVSASVLTCATPAMSGAGTVGVSLVNRDGQAASLPSAFAFS